MKNVLNSHENVTMQKSHLSQNNAFSFYRFLVLVDGCLAQDETYPRLSVRSEENVRKCHYCMNKAIDKVTVAFERTLVRGAPPDPSIERHSIPHCFLPPPPLTPSPRGTRGAA